MYHVAAGKVECADGLLIERRLLAAGDHDDLGREVLEAHRDLEIVARLVTFLTGRHHADIPAVFDQTLSIVVVLNDNAEIAIAGTVVLVLLTGKVPEDNAGVFDDDVVSSFTTHD